MANMSGRILYILYNADASVMGKLNYGYRKLRRSSESEPACAACDITHGGLSLNESPQWLEAKREIESSSDLKVVQWHRDEVSPKLKNFLEQKGLRYPSVVLDEGNETLMEVLSSSDLTDCKGDPKAMVAKLRELGRLQQPQASL